MQHEIKVSLEAFVRGELGLDQLKERLEGRAELRFWDTDQRDVALLHSFPETWFSRADIDAQLKRFLAGTLGARELSDWAGGLRLLGCFTVNEADPGSSEVWDLLDELMSPDVWGAITTESVLDLRRRLNAP